MKSRVFHWSEWRDSNSRPLEPHRPGVPPGPCKHTTNRQKSGYFAWIADFDSRHQQKVYPEFWKSVPWRLVCIIGVRWQTVNILRRKTYLARLAFTSAMASAKGRVLPREMSFNPFLNSSNSSIGLIEVSETSVFLDDLITPWLREGISCLVFKDGSLLNNTVNYDWWDLIIWTRVSSKGIKPSKSTCM